jgi:hypothetical protein
MELLERAISEISGEIDFAQYDSARGRMVARDPLPSLTPVAAAIWRRLKAAIALRPRPLKGPLWNTP